MKTYRLPIVIMYAASVSVAAFADDDHRESHGTQPFHATMAATAINKDDFSFTGVPLFNGTSGALRVHADLTGDSTYGHYIAQAQFEAVYTSPFPLCTQPGGAGGVQAVYKGFVLVMSFEEKQDQLFLALTSGTDCFNPAIGINIGQVTFRVVGGTGRFEGATGTIVNPYKGIGLARSALGPSGFFNAVSGTFDGFITLK